jgi:para-nitrobenzyl esterase
MSLPQSEDCLFLNIYAPSHPVADSHRPVMVWIHGGALITGTGASYDPSDLVAANGIIVVTINYRLGALGWLVEPGLTAAEPNFFEKAGDAGNYGLMDQQFALRWVRRNIARFGGDPKRVTVAGQSAGALSVASLLASTETGADLFRGAIIESGAYQLHDLPSQAEYGGRFGADFDAALGCSPPSDAPCLRAAPVSAILAAQARVFASHGISPDVGTRILPRALDRALATGEFIRVPVLQGTAANEGRFFEPQNFPFASTPPNIQAAGGPANFDLKNPNSFCATPQGTLTACTYSQEIALYVAMLSGALGIPTAADSGSFVDRLAREYPLANFPDRFLPNDAPSADEALSQVFTDLVFACNANESSGNLSRFVPVFGYEFDDPNAPPGTAPIKPPNDVFGFPSASEHGSEVQFLFNFGRPLSADEQQLADTMKTYWANFVRTGDPNFPRPVPAWLPFNGTDAVQHLIPAPQIPHPFFTFEREHVCRTWQPIIATETPK